MSQKLPYSGPEPETATILRLEHEKALWRQPGASQRALAWILSAGSAVEAVYPSISFARAVPPEVEQAFQDAWAACWFEGSISEDEMKNAWRDYYRSCL